MKKIVVTAGDKYTDIDVLACSVAYTELLNREGKIAQAVLPGVFNKSVTDKIKSWNFKFSKKYKGADAFVIVDVSHPRFFSKFVDENKITEIYDHHSGFEDYWKERLGKNAKIEMIGACATLIWEEYLKRIKPLAVSSVSANLLYTAIISQTLVFNISITSKRDKRVARELKKFTDLPNNWIETYFKDQEADVFKNPIREIKNDTHIEDVPQFDEKIIIGQIELWNSGKFIKKHLPEIEKALKSFGNPKWFLTSPSISEGKNYVYTKNTAVKKLLAKAIGVKFKGNLGTTKKLWLRKEILKKLQDIDKL